MKKWVRRSTAAALFTARAARSRAEGLTDLNMVRYAVTVSGKPESGVSRVVSWSMNQPGTVYVRVAEHLKLVAEPCSLLLLGTGVIGLSLLFLRERFRIQPEALIEAQNSSRGLPDSAARV